jgi:hypothetical protein
MDEPFSINNSGYWLKPSGWPSWSAEDEYRRHSDSDCDFLGQPVTWAPTWVFLLHAVNQIGMKAWGDRWRTPPFRLDQPDGAAALNRFMRTIRWIRARCDGGVLTTCYEVCEGTGPDGRFEPEEGDDLRGKMHGVPHEDWFGPGWERLFLLGAIRTGWENWIYVHRGDLVNFLARVKLQPEEPAPGTEPAPMAESAGGRGRPPEYDWPDGIAFAEQQLNQRGDPKQPENRTVGWRCDADVGKAVITYLAKHNGGREPDIKNAMKRIGPAIKEWRRKNA